MNSSRYRLSSRLPTGLRRLRASTTSSTGTTSTGSSLRPQVLARQASLSTQDRFSFCEEDLVDLDPEELLEAYASYRAQIDWKAVQGIQLDNSKSFLARSRSSLSRFRSFSKRPRHQAQDPSPSEQQPALDPAPPHDSIPVPSLDSHSSAAESRRPTLDFSQDLFRTDPIGSIGLPSNPQELISSDQVLREVVLDPNQITPSPPGSRVSTPTTLTPSAAVSGTPFNPFRGSLRRLRTLTKGSLFASRNPAPEVWQIHSKSHPAATHREASSPLTSLYLPELSFDSTPLSILIQEEGESLEGEETPQPTPQPLPQVFASPDLAPARPTEAAPTVASLPIVKYEFVSPGELTESPAGTLISRFSIAATPLPAASPSWLSRNVYELERLARQIPPSPDPLPVPYRAYLSKATSGSVPATPRSTNSSLTLNISHKRLSVVSRSFSRESSVNRLSILRYRQSVAESRKSIQSFITCASLVLPDGPNDTLESVPEKPHFFLLLHPPSPEAGDTALITPESQAPSLSPLEAFDSSNPILRLPSLVTGTPSEKSPSLVPTAPSSERSYDIFIPSSSPYDLDEPITLPEHLLALAKSIVRESSTNMSYSGNKPADTVDFGDEADYSGYEWFKDPPPRPEAQPQPASEPYIPQPGVIEQNDAFDYALKSAPNVLYGRWKQYGQLGVLAWCSEFGELIDALKVLGFEGNMFVSTRTQALQTCEEILRLDLQIEMQIIVMYLSSQVARLRRFLDHDRQWEDYPKPTFPQENDYIRAGH